MNTFHLIHNGEAWTLQREGQEEPLEVYANMSKESALAQVSEDLRGLSAEVCVHRQPSFVPQSWHRPLEADTRLSA